MPDFEAKEHKALNELQAIANQEPSGLLREFLDATKKNLPSLSYDPETDTASAIVNSQNGIIGQLEMSNPYGTNSFIAVEGLDKQGHQVTVQIAEGNPNGGFSTFTNNDDHTTTEVSYDKDGKVRSPNIILPTPADAADDADLNTHYDSMWSAHKNGTH